MTLPHAKISHLPRPIWMEGLNVQEVMNNQTTEFRSKIQRC